MTVDVKKTILILFVLTPAILLGQQRRTTAPKIEELPRRAMDTVSTANNNVQIIIYTNNTWSYYYPKKDSLLKTDIFEKQWDTTHVFSYPDVELKDLPGTVELNLINSIDDYHSPTIGRISSKYGPRGRRNHHGIDIPLKTGEPIYATFSGKVRYAQYNSGGFGNLVIIRHGNGLETWYAHLIKCNVEVNDYVTAGAVIGFGGNTGRSFGSHLHYEMRYCDQSFDPEHLIDFSTGDIRYQTFALEKSYFSMYSRASATLDED